MTDSTFRLEPVGPESQDKHSPDLSQQSRQRIALSRFAYLRIDPDGGWVLESPTASHRLRTIDTQVLEAVRALGSDTTVEDYLAGGSGDRLELLQALAKTGLVDVVPEGERVENSWDFHDLVFHTASRLGHGSHPRGATFPGGDKPPPPMPALGNTDLIPLRRPTQRFIAPDSLEDVLSRRRSHRSYSRPLLAQELSEFLHLSCATLHKTETGGEHPYEAQYRPYPSGGGLHSLGVYAVAVGVAELPRGVYRYDSESHGLEPIPVPPGAVERLFADHGLPPFPSPQTPSVLLVITARMDRVAWKYSGIAYSLVLKEVGGLFQTFYLVATRMGLSPCAWGTGDPTAFEAATGIDRMREPTVGEFLLGPQ